MNELLSCLNLSSLSNDYVKSQWEDGFSADETEIMMEYELHLQSIPLENVLLRLSSHIQTCVKNGSLKNWRSLLEEDFDHRRILCVLHFLFTSAIKCNDENSRKKAFCGVRFYFGMLSVPDSHVFSIFQPNLYLKALKLITLPIEILRGHDRKSREEDDIYSDISHREARELMGDVSDALEDLNFALAVGNFGKCRDSLPQTAEILSYIARQETNVLLFSSKRLESAPPIPGNLSYCAFQGLRSMCVAHHGHVEETIRIVMKNVFDMIQLSFQKDFSSREGNIVRENALGFVNTILNVTENNAHAPILILLQFLCLHAPDRSEPRGKLVENIFSLFLKLSGDFFRKSLTLLLELSCSDRSLALRLFTISLLGKLLFIDKEDLLLHVRDLQVGDSAPEHFASGVHNMILVAVISRFEDISAAVTTKALTILSDYIEYLSKSKIVEETIARVFIVPYITEETVEQVPFKALKNFHCVLKTFKANPHYDSDILPCGRAILCELLELADDDKVLVRRAALQCIVRILCLNEKFMAKDVLKKISSHCRDRGVLVRKMMVQELTDLVLSYPSHERLSKEWAVNILPLVVDTEVKVVENVLESIAKVIIENMVEESRMHTEKHHLPWKLINLISDLQLRKFFLEACRKWDKSVLRPAKIMAIVKSQIGITKPHNTAAWAMLMSLSEFIPIKDSSFVLEFYRNEVHNIPDVSTYLSQLVMEVLWFSWRHLSIEDQKLLVEELNMDLMLFKIPVPLISRALDVCHGIHKELNNTPDNDKMLLEHPKWAVDLIKQCEEGIVDMLRASQECVQDEEVMQRFVSTLGNVALYCPGIIQNSTVNQLQFMLVPPQSHQPAGSSCFWTGTCSTEMKAGLIITLGKLSLQNLNRAQDLVKIFGSLLNETDESVLKSNIMICLTDLCIRYASLVEGLLPGMCVCLKDCQRIVRENTLVLLIQLLQEDYLKMRDRLMFNLLTMLNDVDSTIRGMTRTFFADTVLQKHMKFFSSHFTQALFHYNGYKNHQKFSKVKLSSREEEVFNLCGDENKEQRRDIYRFILSLLEENCRVVISQILCLDVCKGVLEDSIDLNEQGQGVLSDALFVMNCEEIRHTDKKDGEEDGRLDSEDVESPVNAAQKALFSEIRKKHLVEIEVPVLAGLCKKLTGMFSSLVKDVRRNLLSIAREDKIDLSDILEGEDAHILRELNFDIRHADRRTSVSSTNSSTSSSSEEYNEMDVVTRSSM